MVSACGTQNVNKIKTKQLVKIHSQKLDFPELTAEDVNFKIRTICTIYADKLR
jgi:hypothetical protein